MVKVEGEKERQSQYQNLFKGTRVNLLCICRNYQVYK